MMMQLQSGGKSPQPGQGVPQSQARKGPFFITALYRFWIDGLGGIEYSAVRPVWSVDMISVKIPAVVISMTHRHFGIC